MMLSRFAENAFWMGRYVERIENLVRLVAVTEGFAADQSDEAAWAPILKANSDTAAFKETGKELTGPNVARFYLYDRNNMSSVAYSVHMVKENARSLRHLISTESWRQVTLFHELVIAASKKRFAMSRLSDICEEIRIACFTHRGVMEATCYRDEVFQFNRLGAALERADQMTRLIDVKYFRSDDDDDAPVTDVAWWNTLLRTASGYHAFQRTYSFNPAPADAAHFLLFDEGFPRSVKGAAETALTCLKTLDRKFAARPGAEVTAAAEALADRLDNPPERLTGRPLHRYIDQIQSEIIALANALFERYFSPEA
ncbi:MAG: alpha-E domain-containing protein [Parvularculaceae bacterium]